MKKLLLKFMGFLNSSFLQLLLSIVACLSWMQTEELAGNLLEWTFEDGFAYSGFGVMTRDGGPIVQTSSGFDGGALAMGLITCMCIFGIVQLQINKNKFN